LALHETKNIQKTTFANVLLDLKLGVISPVWLAKLFEKNKTKSEDNHSIKKLCTHDQRGWVIS